MAYITINKENFFNNLGVIAKQAGSLEQIALVLKDNAYGHGLTLMAKLAAEYGVSKAVVQNEHEAHEIAAYFSYILILSDKPKTPQKHFRYVVNTLENIESFSQEVPVELKVDTGMHRNGVDAAQLEKAVKTIQRKNLKLEAVFTHHRAADELSSEWYWQNQNFSRLKNVAKGMVDGLRFHSANSASLFRTPEFHEDMARVGIAAYGCMELPFGDVASQLKPVLSLWGERIATRTLQKGSRVGYSGVAVLKREEKVTTYDVGYGDGFMRSIDTGYKTPDGVELLGRISMDSSSFVCSDETLLIFDDARVVASKLKSISYEVLTALKPNLKRVVV